MTSTTLEDINYFLNNENWTYYNYQTNTTSNYFKYQLDYGLYKWDKYSYGNTSSLQLFKSADKQNIIVFESSESCFNALLTDVASKFPIKTKESTDYKSKTCVDGKITIEFRKYNTYRSSGVYSILYYHAPSLSAEISRVKKIEDEKIRLEKQRIARIEEVYSEVERLKNEKQFDEAISKYDSISSIVSEEDSLGYRINLLKKEKCTYYIQKGDAYFEASNFENAVDNYMLAQDCDNESFDFSNKIRKTNAKIKEIKVSQKIIEANAFLENKNYIAALKSYKEIYSLDPNNYVSSNKIDEINSILEVLEKRKNTIFSYKETNFADYTSLLKNISKELNITTKMSSDGSFSFEYLIAFDTLGNNTSKYSITNSTSPLFASSLSKIPVTTLTKPMLKGFYIASKENLAINLNWKSNLIGFKSSWSGIKQVSSGNVDLKLLSNFFNQQAHRYGEFTFEVKSKTLNNSTYTDISLVKYKNDAGPLCTFYSMLLPGLGTLKVTHDKKGWGRMTTFILSAGLGVLSNSLAIDEYNQYKKAIDQTSLDKHYAAANLYTNTSLAMFSFSATIYVYDVIYVFSKGCKNVYESKGLRKSLKNAPILVNSEEISIK
jgi:tetratricopeptide (TPR) repeat protein